MAKKKKATPDKHAILSAEAARQFEIGVKDLEVLMQTRGHEGIRELNEIHGGLSGLAQKLKTNFITGKT